MHCWQFCDGVKVVDSMLVSMLLYRMELLLLLLFVDVVMLVVLRVIVLLAMM